MIQQTTTWESFPALWPALLGEVWEAVRGHPAIAPGRNVMLYLDDVPNVEVGVEAAGRFAPIGRVVPSALPAGRAMAVTHRAGYAEIQQAHRAVVDACDRQGLERLGPRWEIYGHQDDDASVPQLDVYHLVRAEP